MLIKKIKNFIQENKLLSHMDRVVIGFSGGPDSVFLLHVLLQLRDELALEISLAHINHLLRGIESDGDEEFTKEIARKYNLPIYVKRQSMQEYARSNKIGDEEAGREIRYAFFDEVLAKSSSTKVALAHNLDDEVETFLFRLMRGTSLSGLEGIPVKRDRIVRPILNTYKNEIMNYLNEKNIEYRVDSSNLENKYTRNSIRLDLIPMIEDRYNHTFKDKIVSLMDEIKEVNSIIEVDYKRYLKEDKIQIKSLLGLPNYQQKKVLNNYLTNYGVTVSRRKLESILSLLKVGGSKELSLGKTLKLKKEYDELFVRVVNECKEVKERVVELTIPGEISYNGYKIIVTDQEDDRRGYYIDIPKGEELVIRSRKPGDRIVIDRDGRSKKLKDILINDKVPKEKRDTLPIVSYQGEIVLIAGVRGSEKFRANSQEQNKMKLIVEEGNFSGRE